MKVKVKSVLQGKRSVFEALVLGERTRLPVLLLGDRGTGKTRAVLDYFHSKNLSQDQLFIIQLSPETRAEEILGHISIPDLREGRLKRIGGIQNAQIIVIDEVDKASSQVRNLLLSSLNEKQIFDGEKMVNLNYSLFVGTANSLPADDDIPFLDRFIIKQNVERIGRENIPLLVKADEQIYEFDEIDISTLGESDGSVLEMAKAVASELYDLVSDRTITHILPLLKSVLQTGEYDLDGAAMRTAEMLTGNIVELKCVSESEGLKRIRKVVRDYNLESNNEVTKTKYILMLKEMLKEIVSGTGSWSLTPQEKEKAVTIITDTLDSHLRKGGNANV